MGKRDKHVSIREYLRRGTMWTSVFSRPQREEVFSLCSTSSTPGKLLEYQEITTTKRNCQQTKPDIWHLWFLPKQNISYRYFCNSWTVFSRTHNCNWHWERKTTISKYVDQKDKQNSSTQIPTSIPVWIISNTHILHDFNT